MQLLQIASTPINQSDGLYSLNDLHQSAGGHQKHRPKYFLENQQTTALVAEICKGGIPPIQSYRGNRSDGLRGTYACKELVYAYAMWISPKFNLMVIRAFDAQQTTNTAQYSAEPSNTLEVSGIEYMALQARNAQLQAELLQVYKDKITELENRKRPRRAATSVATFNLDAYKEESFNKKVCEALTAEPNLNKTELLQRCGYPKDDKSARKLLDIGTNTHWFCLKHRGVFRYNLSAENLSGGAH